MSTGNLTRRKLTPPQYAEQLGVNPAKVIGWIRSGALLAIDVGNASRPRYLIDADDIDTFERSRAVTPAVTPFAGQR